MQSKNKRGAEQGEKLEKLFCDLVKISSPSGMELNMAMRISSYLSKNGIPHHFDNANKKTGGNTGNLIAKLEGKGPTIMFVAHMDTVEDGKKPITPVIKGGIIHSDGTTILGVDNKASVAALLSALREIKEKRHCNILAVFSVNEEQGIMGASSINISPRPDYAFVIDGSGHPGTFMNEALGHSSFKIKIIGKEAHAAFAPETGRNALKAAGLLIAKQKFEAYSDGSIVNAGTISGGSRTNIIPGTVLIEGEVRGRSAKSMAKRLIGVKSTLSEACDATGCGFKFYGDKDPKQPFSVNPSSKIAKLASKASQAAGLKFDIHGLKATTEANVLCGKYPNILIMAGGGANPHSNSESISIHELYQLKSLIISLIESASS
jgi:tripeptide aminopeptidase